MGLKPTTQSISRPGRSLSDDDLGEAGDEEVVGQSLDAAGGELRALAAQRARELAIVGVLLVRRLGAHVALDAVLAERVQTAEALGTPVRLEADLADEELVVDLLCQASAERTRRRNHEQLVTKRLSSRRTALPHAINRLTDK